MLRGLAFDAGGNQAATQAVTVTIAAPAEASLHLPEPPVVPVGEPLQLSFSRPITASTLVLRFDPPVGFIVLAPDGDKAMIVHAPFQPGTR